MTTKNPTFSNPVPPTSVKTDYELRIGGGFHAESICIMLMLPGMPAILDCCLLEQLGGKREWVLTRVNVPDAHRGKGYGTKLLLALLELADKAKAEIGLGVSSSNPKFTNGKLRAWYKRHGFVKPTGAPTNVLTRKPKTL